MEVAPHVIDSVLRCLNWDDDFKSFFRLKCPLFKDFSKVDAEFDLGMTAVHLDFIELLETSLKKHISPIMRDPLIDDIMVCTIIGKSLDSSSSPSSSANPVQTAAAESIMGQLDRYMDFRQFGLMMEDKFNELFATAKPPGGADGEEGAQRQQAGAVKAVRVLWDIENVGVRREIGALQTVARLNSFLEKRGLHGASVDCRITAFFRPDRGKTANIPQKVIDDLDRAAVEMVWVSTKREDADRKLVNRIHQEMAVLPPATTTFVVVSSDQDFRTQYQELLREGYRVLVMHNATNAKWTETLALHVSESFHFQRDVLLLGDKNGNPGGDGDSEDGRATALQPSAPSASTGRSTGPSPRKIRTMSGHALDRVVLQPADMQALPPGVWYAACCMQWRGTFGFLKTDMGQRFGTDVVNSASSKENGDDVAGNDAAVTAGITNTDATIKTFVHKSAMSGLSRSELVPAEILLVQVNLTDSKGPKATKVFLPPSQAARTDGAPVLPVQVESSAGGRGDDSRLPDI